MKPDITTLLIDLDDTVYPSSIGVWPFLMKRIYNYMREVVGIPPHLVDETRDRLFYQYGTTLKGLQHEYGTDMQDYLVYVHDVDLSDYFKPDPALQACLAALPHTKWIFTNASRSHAENVLGLLGVRSYFLGIIDVVDTAPWCKPERQSFEVALELAGSPDPRHCLFVDDRAPNLDTARALGMLTLQVTEEPNSHHPAISRLCQLQDFLASL